MIINRQLRSYVDSYDHASRSVACSYDHCIGAVTIILPENTTTISLMLLIYRVFCLVTNNDQLHIYIVCKLYVSPWHASITMRPGPNSLSPTSAILYDRNCYDRNCFPIVQMSKIAVCACAGNARNVFPRCRLQRKSLVSDPGMHYGTCVAHVSWCMSGSRSRGGGENIPGACAHAILRIWQDTHGKNNTIYYTTGITTVDLATQRARFWIQLAIC